MNFLAVQQLVPLLLKVEAIEECMVTTRDFNQIIGHDFAKCGFVIAASAGHFVLMERPPGCGKSLMAETFPTTNECLEDIYCRRKMTDEQARKEIKQLLGRISIAQVNSLSG